MTDCLSPNACAKRLGVTGEFIRGEIHDKRLPARIFTRPSGRKVYRIESNDFDVYVERYWPNVPRETLANTANTEIR